MVDLRKLAKTDEREAEYLSHCDQWVIDRWRLGTPITKAEYASLPGMNSYERQLLIPLFDVDLLIQELEYAHKNSFEDEWTFPQPPTLGYPQAVMRHYLPQLLRKLKALRP